MKRNWKQEAREYVPWVTMAAAGGLAVLDLGWRLVRGLALVAGFGAAVVGAVTVAGLLWGVFRR